MFKGKFNTRGSFLCLLCGLGFVVQMAVAMEPSGEVVASEECKTSERVSDYQERALERQIASQDITKISHNTPFEYYLKSGAYNRRVQTTLSQTPNYSTDQLARPHVTNVFPQIIPPATLMPTVATSRLDALSLSGQNCTGKESCLNHYNDLGNDVPLQACHRRIKSASGRLSEYLSKSSSEDRLEYNPGGRDRLDDDCCDDICYECCCVKDGCICCGTSLLIVGLIWLKNSAGSVQE